MEKKQAFILFGASGSGKGTQAELLEEKLRAADGRDVLQLGTGARFRQLAEDKGSYVARRSAEMTEQGGLQPVFLSVWNWTEAFMEELEEDMHVILDGSPRRRREPPILESAFDFLEYEDIHIIYLNVPDEVVYERMKARGRADDEEAKIQRRMAWYTKYVIPMLDYYRDNERYHFHEIDGAMSVEDVHADIMKKIGLE